MFYGECRLLALFGPDGLGGRCLLLTAKPTSRSHARTSQFDPKETLRARAGRAVPARAVHAGGEGRGRFDRAWIAFDLAFRLLGIAIFGAVARRSRLCPATSALFHNRLLAPAPEGE